MRKAVKSYAERSAERAAPQEEPWERSMRGVIRDNYDAIKIDIPKIGTVGVLELLEEERQDHFEAFLAEREHKARARLNRNPLDAEASRQLEWIEAARRNPPFKPFNVTSFSQALHLEKKARRAAGNSLAASPETPKRVKRLSSTEALKKAAADEATSQPTASSATSRSPTKMPLPTGGAGGPPAAPAEAQKHMLRLDNETEIAGQEAQTNADAKAHEEQPSSQITVGSEHNTVLEQTQSVASKVQSANRRGTVLTRNSEKPDDDDAMPGRVN